MRLSVIVLALALLAVLAIAFLPLRFALDRAGIFDGPVAARNVSGSVWSGRIEGLTLGPLLIGDVDAGLEFLPLLTGQTRLVLDRQGSANVALHAVVGKDGNALIVEDATGTLDLGRQLAPLPAAQITLDRLSVRFVGERCDAAAGAVQIAFESPVQGLSLGGTMRGNVRCEDGLLLLPVAGPTGRQELALTLAGDGRYGARLFIAGNDTARAVIMPALGFRAVPGGYAMRVEGKLRR